MSKLLAQDERAREVLDFWFGEGADYGKSRRQWFRKSVEFDDQCYAAFVAVYEAAAADQLAHWQQQAQDCLALIVVLDQFPRNMFRGTARAFATDELARTATHHALAQGYDREMLPVEREFLYLPLEHSENLADQELCLRLMTELSAFAETRDLHIWAEKHLAIVKRFGRFPHRNAQLGRESTAAEIEFLKQPGSRF
ncbi:MAG TPA: DUF924 family protein [Usitatibacteraceae bacterium]